MGHDYWYKDHAKEKGNCDGQACRRGGGPASRLLARDGAQVVIADVNRAKGEALAKELGALYPGAARFAPCDVTSAESMEAGVNAGGAAFRAPHLAGWRAGRG